MEQEITNVNGISLSNIYSGPYKCELCQLMMGFAIDYDISFRLNQPEEFDMIFTEEKNKMIVNIR